MMIEMFLPYVVGLFGGLGLGLLYFGGLWLTVGKIPTSRHPSRLLLVSTVLRFGTTLLVLFLVGKEYPLIFLSMLPGFFGGRYFMIHRVGGINRRRIHAS